MKTPNKYNYGWKLYVNYGKGWEFETFELTRKGMKENKRSYLESCRYPQKWVYGRVKNDQFDYEIKNSKISAYLQHGKWGGPYQTEKVDCISIERPLNRSLTGSHTICSSL